MTTRRTDDDDTNGLKVLGEPEPEPDEPAGTIQDIDPAEWLSTSAEVITDYVTIRVGGIDRRMKIAALTEDEFARQLEASKRKAPGQGMGRKVDPILFKRMLVAYSLNKASGKVGETGQLLPGAINHLQLAKQLSGQVTEIQNAVSKLSGFERDKEMAEQNKLFFD